MSPGRRGPTAVHVLLMIAFAAVGAVLAYLGKKAGRVAQLIAGLPTTPIASIRSGLVEIKGRISPLSREYESPYTNTPCVYYHFRVVQGSGKNSRTIINDRKSAICEVSDGTGSCQVNLPLAEMLLDHVTHGRSGTWSEVSPEVERMLQTRYRRSTKGWLFTKSMRYTETVLRTGEHVYVLGTARKARGVDVMRVTKGGSPFIVSDRSERTLLEGFGMKRSLYWFGAVALWAVALGALVVGFVG